MCRPTCNLSLALQHLVDSQIIGKLINSCTRKCSFINGRQARWPRLSRITFCLFCDSFNCTGSAPLNQSKEKLFSLLIGLLCVEFVCLLLSFQVLWLLPLTVLKQMHVRQTGSSKLTTGVSGCCFYVALGTRPGVWGSLQPQDSWDRLQQSNSLAKRWWLKNWIVDLIKL